MRWLKLARADLVDAVRSRRLHLAVGVFVVVAAALAFLSTGSPGPGPGRTLPVALLAPMLVVVPLVAVGVSYESVAGPRTSGSLHLVLGLAYARRDVVVGTAVARVLVVTAAAVAGTLALALVALLRGVVVAPLPLVSGAALLVAFGAVFASLGVGVSAAARSTSTAGALAAGLFVLLAFWGTLVDLLAYAVNGLSTPATTPDWAAFLLALSPVDAYGTLAGALAPPGVGAFGGSSTGSPALAVAVLVVWAVAGPALGYVRFSRDDL